MVLLILFIIVCFTIFAMAYKNNELSMENRDLSSSISKKNDRIFLLEKEIQFVRMNASEINKKIPDTIGGLADLPDESFNILYLHVRNEHLKRFKISKPSK